MKGTKMRNNKTAWKYWNCKPVIAEKQETEDKPEQGKIYSLFGGKGEPCIAKGNTWAESEVKEDKEATE
jgi:hypothetical protein